MYKSYSELGVQPEQNVDHFSIVELENIQHKNQIISQNRIVVVDTYADWCGPCRQIAPSYAVLSTTYNNPGECMLVKENLDKKLSSNITGVPTFQFFVNGKKVDEVVGGDLEAVENKLKQLLQEKHRSVSTPGPQFNRNALRTHGSLNQGQNIGQNSGYQYH